MSDMFERAEPIDLITVTDKLRVNGKLESIGGPVFLSEMASEVPTSANIENYAEKIESSSYHRTTQSIIAKAHIELDKEFSTAEEVMTNLLDASAKLKSKRGVKRPESSLEAVRKTLSHIEHVKSKKYTGGLQTGIERVDRIIVEFDPGELVIIAARPSIGKTVAAATIAEHNAKKGIYGMFFSLEMETKQVVMRSLSRESGVPLHSIRDRWKLSDEKQRALESAAAKISDWPIIYDDNRYENALQIGNAVRAQMVRTPLKYIIVDQLSKVRPDYVASNEHRMHLNSILSGLKGIAKSLGITVFLLHQINRDVKTTKDHRPKIDDLKDTGNVEEDADGVILLHRPEYYNPNYKKFKIAGEDYDVAGHAEWIIAKRRQGATGSAAVGFIGSLTKFYNLDAPRQETEPYNPTPEPQHMMEEELPF